MKAKSKSLRVALLTLSLGLAAVVGVPAGPAPVAAAPPDGPDALADFEGGTPPGWFNFFGGSSVTTSTQVVPDTDPLARPGQAGDNEILVADYNVFDFGGFGQDVALANDGPQDWSTTAGMSFWFYGSGSGLAYQAEVSDNRSDPGTDTSERFDYTFTDDSAGWRLITIPWSDFNRATDFQPGGAPDDGLTLTEVWAWAIVLPLGADTVYFDDVRLDNPIVDDFENGVAPGTPCAGIPLGFCTFQGAGSSVALSTTDTPPAPLPSSVGPNNVMQVDLDVTSFAGFIHGFTNDAADAWVPQDWSSSEGLAFWLYGNNSGTSMFVDILDNRNPGSTSDDAERWSVTIGDDFGGWRYFEIPFSAFVRKGVGNNAPDDGFGLTEVHGWAFGTLGTGGPRTFYIDDVALYGAAGVAELAVGFSTNNYDITEGDTGTITVGLNRPLADGDPTEVTVDYAIETVIAEEGRDFEFVADGSFTFVTGGPSEQSFTIQTIEDDKYEPTERLILRLSNPEGAAPGVVMQAAANILDDDPYDRLLLDDFEGEPYFWDTTGPVSLAQRDIAPGDADALPGQIYPEGVLDASVPLAVDARISGLLCQDDRGGDRSNSGGNGVVPFAILTTDIFDATTIDHTTVRLGDAAETHTRGNRAPVRHEEDVDGDGDTDLVFHVRRTDVGGECDPGAVAITGATFDGQAITAGGSDAALTRDFPIGQNWTDAQGLTLWYYGSGSGDEIRVDLLDNRAPDPGPDGWELVWADEFDDPAGTPPNPDNWGYEIGDGTVNGIPGWGNSELQYYTDSTQNAATDGDGNLVITVADAGGESCYYGPCEYTSARLVTTNRAEFAYGRIEARVQVPNGDDGLWPAVWSLGTDIERVTWPQTGEIDIMEYVSRIPTEIFGTIHGPGYSGGNAYGDTFDFGERVGLDYHTFTIEWQPNYIEWYVDGNLYHTAAPADVAPNEWVFNDPVYLLMNLAVGGNFGGPVADTTTFPQEMKVDYVRVEQAPDTAERFEATFVDSMEGWYQYTIPFDNFVRSADQPAGAPDDGLTLSEVWGYGFATPSGTSTGSVVVDQVRLDPVPPPPVVTVTSLANGGAGSLREAIQRVADGGTVDFDPALSGGTVNLTTGPIVVDGKTVSIDASAAPGLSLNGGGGDRVLIVEAGAGATVRNLTLTNGYGFQLAGCVLNNGTLTLQLSTVTGCVMTTDAGDFWQGGAGVYNSDGATFILVDSTVADNSSGHAGGGVFSFFNTTTTIERSTISGNGAADVGGGIRSLGSVDVVNSTISGNTASANFHGGAVFVTDGVMNMVNTTVAGNTSTGGTGDVFVGTFTGAGATVNLTNTIIESGPGSGAACFQGFFGAGAVVLNSNGGNLATDGTCNLTGAGDLPNTDPLLGPLADNGGPTQTHALDAGSPAIDAADTAACPATDQRGVARVGACDVGSFEFTP